MKDMKQNRKTRYTRMVLQDSLIELMQQKPISKITIKEICENADINRTTFYAHFTDQYHLLQSIEDETLSWAKDTITNLIEIDRTEANKILESIFDYFIENSNHIQVLMSEQGNINFQKKLIELIFEHCSTTLYDQNKINISDGMNEYYFMFVVSGCIGIIQHWLKSGLNKSAKEMADIIFNAVFLSDKFYSILK